MQGSWRIVSLAEGGGVSEVPSDAQSDPKLDFVILGE
jgi:hypothetical protein